MSIQTYRLCFNSSKNLSSPSLHYLILKNKEYRYFVKQNILFGKIRICSHPNMKRSKQLRQKEIEKQVEKGDFNE